MGKTSLKQVNLLIVSVFSAQFAVSDVFDDERLCGADRSVFSPPRPFLFTRSLKSNLTRLLLFSLTSCGSKGKSLRRQFSPRGPKKKNWCYVSQEAAQLDREDPVKTWDHLIMPLSFPHLDFEQMSVERSHTAPEKSAVRIYYSPPSARRVQLAQTKQSPVVERESVSTLSPWCTPPTSFSALCLASSANLSDDLKEMTASWRQAGPERGRLERRCSGTQTHTRPQMVSVGLQTDSVRSSPSRGLGSSSLVSARSHHISASLDGVAGRLERSRASASSPKLYRRHSASGVSPVPSSAGSTSRDRALWNVNHQTHSSGLTWSRQPSPRAAAAAAGTKPPSKAAATNRYGLVTEFLRRVSGRAEKPAPASGPKTKNGLKNLERVPTRPPVASLHRTDSVTRIVNQRFMKQREEAGGRGSSLNQGARQGTTPTAEVREVLILINNHLFSSECGLMELKQRDWKDLFFNHLNDQ